MPHPIVDDELELLRHVRDLLERNPERSGPSERAIVDELRRLRSVIVSGSESKDAAVLTEQWHQQTALLRQIREGRGESVDPGSPYFAHLRLSEDGRTQDLCLGRATRIDSGLRIVDWRNAPISRLFYRYEQGEEYEEVLAERTRIGSVVARRSVTIRKGELRRIEAPEGTFSRAPDGDGWIQRPSQKPRLAGGEGAAARALAVGGSDGRRLGHDRSGTPQRADKHLPDIAALIDPAQFDLITRPSSGFVVIRGAAGSGKTTVALHRIAYLAYSDEQVDSPRTLFVVFSRALRQYVRHVLPSLGVHNARVCTFGEWVGEQCRRLFPELPRGLRHDTPSLVSRLKLHPAIQAVIARQVERVPGEGTSEQVMDDWASALGQSDALFRDFDELAPGAFLPEQIDRISDWCARRSEEIQNWLAGDREEEPGLDFEDQALLLRCYQQRVGPLPGGGKRVLRYRHIAVDEVQDFSPIEVGVLLNCLDSSRSITLAGDSQQHIQEESGFESWSGFLQDLGVTGTEVSTLRVSYRSSAEIVQYSRTLLGPLAEDGDPPLVTRSGPPVEQFEFTDRGACVAFLSESLFELSQAEPLASVAVLTPSPEASRLYYDGLAEGDVPRLRLVQNQEFTFAPGVEVTEVEQVKGLEFDYVILVDADRHHYPATSLARRLLHVGATRAIHQLWLTHVADPSPIASEALNL